RDRMPAHGDCDPPCGEAIVPRCIIADRPCGATAACRLPVLPRTGVGPQGVVVAVVTCLVHASSNPRAEEPAAGTPSAGAAGGYRLPGRTGGGAGPRTAAPSAHRRPARGWSAGPPSSTRPGCCPLPPTTPRPPSTASRRHFTGA